LIIYRQRFGSSRALRCRRGDSEMPPIGSWPGWVNEPAGPGGRRGRGDQVPGTTGWLGLVRPPDVAGPPEVISLTRVASLASGAVGTNESGWTATQEVHSFCPRVRGRKSRLLCSTAGEVLSSQSRPGGYSRSADALVTWLVPGGRSGHAACARQRAGHRAYVRRSLWLGVRVCRPCYRWVAG
jgi:hypothetical protein